MKNETISLHKIVIDQNEIINTLDPDKLQCEMCQEWFDKDEGAFCKWRNNQWLFRCNSCQKRING